MPGAVLTAHEGNPRRRADAHGIELAEPNPAFCQSFHVRRAVPSIQRMLDRSAILVDQKRNRGIHQAHVVDEDNHDIGVRVPFRAPLACRVFGIAIGPAMSPAKRRRNRNQQHGANPCNSQGVL